MAKRTANSVEGPWVVGEENDQKGENLQGHAYDPDRPATQAFRYDGHGPAGKDSDGLLGCEDTGGESQGQATVNGNGHDQHVDDVVSHASPVVDADEVPEGSGTLGLLDEHLGSYLCGLVSLPGLDRLFWKSAEGPQAYLGGSVIEEPGQQKHYRPACYAGKPEYPLHSKLVEGCANQQEQAYCAHSLERPDDAHGDSQVFLLNHRVTPDTVRTPKIVAEPPKTTPKKR